MYWGGIKFAEGATAPESADAQTLAAALTKALVSASVTNYKSTSPADFMYKGEGSLVLKNLSKDAQTVVLPYGFRFKDPARGDVQDMAIFPSAPQR